MRCPAKTLLLDLFLWKVIYGISVAMLVIPTSDLISYYIALSSGLLEHGELGQGWAQLLIYLT